MPGTCILRAPNPAQEWLDLAIASAIKRWALSSIIWDIIPDETPF